METHRDQSRVPAQTSSPPRNLIAPCPFCGLYFKRLGCHLPKCKERRDRTYSAYLSRPPPRDREPRPKRTECPKCHRSFRRLDTHLRVSAICRNLSAAATSDVHVVSGETDSSSPPAPAANATDGPHSLPGPCPR